MTFTTSQGAAILGAGHNASNSSSSQPGPDWPTFALPISRRRVSFGGGPFFASLTTSPLFGTTRAEPATGLLFPAEVCVLTTSNCPKLAGLGVRAKRLLGIKNINVYSVGLYVDGVAAKRALHKYARTQVAGNQKLFDELSAPDAHFERTLRLVISFGSLKRSQFVNALEERLKPALAKAGQEGALQQFAALFDGVSFRKGTEITFTTNGSGRLVTCIDGKQKGAISNKALQRALFDTYLGNDPVSTDAKDSFAQGLAALLEA